VEQVVRAGLVSGPQQVSFESVGEGIGLSQELFSLSVSVGLFLFEVALVALLAKL
jgi:hypothetical protein